MSSRRFRPSQPNEPELPPASVEVDQAVAVKPDVVQAVGSAVVDSQVDNPPAGPDQPPDVSSPSRQDADSILDGLPQFQLIDFRHEQQNLANDFATRQLRSKYEHEQSKFKRFAKTAWYSFFLRDFMIDRYEQQYFKEHKDRVVYDLYAGSSTDPQASKTAIRATIERLEHEEYRYDEAGESSRQVDEAQKEAFEQLKSKFIDRAIDLANGTFDEETYRREHRELLKPLIESGLYDDASALALNIEPVVARVKACLEHGIALEDARLAMQAQKFEIIDARPGMSTSRYETRYAAFAKKMRLRKIAEPVVGTALLTMSIAASTWRGAATSTARALAATGVGLGVSAALTGARQAYIFQRELHDARRLHASGDALSEASSLVHYEKLQYDLPPATELQGTLEQLLAKDSLESTDVRQLGMVVAEVRERLRMSDADRRDYIRYSSVEGSVEERWNLLKLASAGELALEHHAPNGTLTLQDQNLNIKEYLAQCTEAFRAEDSLFTKDKAAKDRQVHIERAKSVAKAAALGLAASLAIGVFAQETYAAANPNMVGVIDNIQGKSIVSGDQRDTVLASLFGTSEYVPEPSDTGGSVVPPPDIKPRSFMLDDVKVRAPQGIDITTSDSHMSFQGPNGEELARVELGKNGLPNANGIEKLREQGILFDTQVRETFTTETRPISADTFVRSNTEQFTKLRTVEWFDNGTPGISDGDELQLMRGGTNGTWFDADGNVRIEVSGMSEHTPDVISVSPSWERQGSAEVFRVKDGAVVIPKNSLSHELFTRNDFHGGLLQAGEVQAGSIEGGRVEVASVAAFRGTNDAVFDVQVKVPEQVISIDVSLTPEIEAELYTSPVSLPVETNTPAQTLETQPFFVAPIPYVRDFTPRSEQPAQPASGSLAALLAAGRQARAEAGNTIAAMVRGSTRFVYKGSDDSVALPGATLLYVGQKGSGGYAFHVLNTAGNKVNEVTLPKDILTNLIAFNKLEVVAASADAGAAVAVAGTTSAASTAAAAKEGSFSGTTGRFSVATEPRFDEAGTEVAGVARGALASTGSLAASLTPTVTSAAASTANPETSSKSGTTASSAPMSVNELMPGVPSVVYTRGGYRREVRLISGDSEHVHVVYQRKVPGKRDQYEDRRVDKVSVDDIRKQRRFYWTKEAAQSAREGIAQAKAAAEEKKLAREARGKTGRDAGSTSAKAPKVSGEPPLTAAQTVAVATSSSNEEQTPSVAPSSLGAAAIAESAPSKKPELEIRPSQVYNARGLTLEVSYDDKKGTVRLQGASSDTSGAEKSVLSMMTIDEFERRLETGVLTTEKPSGATS